MCPPVSAGEGPWVWFDSALSQPIDIIETHIPKAQAVYLAFITMRSSGGSGGIAAVVNNMADATTHERKDS